MQKVVYGVSLPFFFFPFFVFAFFPFIFFFEYHSYLSPPNKTLYAILSLEWFKDSGSSTVVKIKLELQGKPC
jgi:hypothetical protein